MQLSHSDFQFRTCLRLIQETEARGYLYIDMHTNIDNVVNARQNSLVRICFQGNGHKLWHVVGILGTHHTFRG